jgi:putative ABC transport system substrate-binding protein
VTGIETSSPELWQKWLEILKEGAPRVSRVGVLTGPHAPNPDLVERQGRELERAAQILRLRLVWAEIKDAKQQLSEALAVLARQNPEGLVTVNSATLIAARRQILEFALQHRLPTMSASRQFVDEGGLMSYARDSQDMWRRIATYVDKILKGAKPADLPVERPTKFELVINLKTAKALGLTIPPSLLLRADQVIE